MTRPLRGEGAREGHDSALGGRVGAIAGEPDLAQHRGDVDDLPRPLLDQRRRRRAAAVEDTDQVDLKDPGELPRLHLRHRSHARDPRVVHHDVKPAQGVGGPLHQRLHLGVDADIGGDGQGAAPALLDLARGLVEIPLRARGDRDVRARLRQGQRHGPPEPAARAGDDGHPTLEAKGVQHGPVSLAHDCPRSSLRGVFPLAGDTCSPDSCRLSSAERVRYIGFAS